MDCAVVLGEMRSDLVGSQKAGAEAQWVELDRIARGDWFKEFPFASYDTYYDRRRAEYQANDTDVTEYAAYWDILECGRSPWN